MITHLSVNCKNILCFFAKLFPIKRFFEKTNKKIKKKYKKGIDKPGRMVYNIKENKAELSALTYLPLEQSG